MIIHTAYLYKSRHPRDYLSGIYCKITLWRKSSKIVPALKILKSDWIVPYSIFCEIKASRIFPDFFWFSHILATPFESQTHDQHFSDSFIKSLYLFSDIGDKYPGTSKLWSSWMFYDYMYNLNFLHWVSEFWVRT